MEWPALLPPVSSLLLLIATILAISPFVSVSFISNGLL
jgi:hypothetical protein